MKVQEQNGPCFLGGTVGVTLSPLSIKVTLANRGHLGEIVCVWDLTNNQIGQKSLKQSQHQSIQYLALLQGKLLYIHQVPGMF